VVCTANEPQDLFPFGGRSPAKNHVIEALYDGPIDRRSYDYQAVILEKLPSLADGDARIEPVQVSEGDWIVNAAGQLVQLSTGERIRPAGCTTPECEVAWDGSALEMAQLSADFTLLPDLKWSDGVPLTANDSVYGFELARACQEDRRCGDGLVTDNPESVRGTASYTALDERSTRWTGVPGFLDANYRTNFFFPMPEHQLGELDLDELLAAEAMRAPLGWGPFMLESWADGDQIRLVRNPQYFRAGEGLPNFDILVFRFIGLDPEQNLNAISSGNCDVLDREASEILMEAGLQQLLDMGTERRLAVYTIPDSTWEHADFGIQHISYDDGFLLAQDRPDYFGDVRTRQAIAHCLDRGQVVENVLAGLSVVPDTYLPPDHPLANPEVARYPFDPAAGADLLEQAGWRDEDANPETPRVARGIPTVPDGAPFAFTYFTSQGEQRRQAAEILTASLGECGIQATAEFRDIGELFADGPEGPLFGRQFEMAQFAWQTGVRNPCDLYLSSRVPGQPQGEWIPLGSIEPRPFVYGWGGQNLTGFSHPDYDRACTAALEALPGQDGYIESQWESQAIFSAELPAIPLYQRLILAVTQVDLCGFQLDATSWSELWNIEQLYQGETCP
jgi:peptide/nickel transport system substrate-binding protein